MRNLKLMARILVLGMLVVIGCKTHEDARKTCTVSFDPGYGSGTPPSGFTVEEGMVIELPDAYSLYAEGYEFYGWRTGGIVYHIGEEYEVTSDVTFVAQWRLLSYTVTFNGNGGSSPSTQTVTWGDSITLPPITWSNYTFNGWYTDGGTKAGTPEILTRPPRA
ncbi:MAG: InlB B-repeat-containing protein [Treponema sp.]|jgi:hypothetical protein|nr:InlB B-repeat-containing protein [Treponema sp.]